MHVPFFTVYIVIKSVLIIKYIGFPKIFFIY
jgi:hypothetical protein